MATIKGNKMNIKNECNHIIGIDNGLGDMWEGIIYDDSSDDKKKELADFGSWDAELRFNFCPKCGVKLIDTDNFNAIKKMYESTPPVLSQDELCDMVNKITGENHTTDTHGFMAFDSSVNLIAPTNSLKWGFIERLSYFSASYRHRKFVAEEREKALNHVSSDGGRTYDAEFLAEIQKRWRNGFDK